MSRNLLFATVAVVVLAGVGGGAYYVQTHKAQITSNPIVAGLVEQRTIKHLEQVRDDPNAKVKINWSSVDQTGQGVVFHDFKTIDTVKNITLVSKTVNVKFVGDKIDLDARDVVITTNNPGLKINIDFVLLEDLPIKLVYSQDQPIEQKIIALDKTHLVLSNLSMQEKDEFSLKIAGLEGKMNSSIESLDVKDISFNNNVNQIGNLHINSITAHDLDILKIIIAQKEHLAMNNYNLLKDLTIDHISSPDFKLDSIVLKAQDTQHSTFNLLNLVPTGPRVEAMKAKGFPIPDVVNMKATGRHDTSGFYSMLNIEAKNVTNLEFSTFSLPPIENGAPRLQKISFKVTDTGGLPKLLALQKATTPETVAVLSLRANLMVSQIIQMSHVVDKSNFPTLLTNFISGASPTLGVSMEVIDGQGYDPTSKHPPKGEELQLVPYIEVN
jgi:hypothetical protein